MADNFLSGRTGDVTINGTEVAVTQWRVDANVADVTFRNSRLGRFSSYETTFYEATGEVSVDLDIDAPMYGSPANVVLGSELTNVKLIVTGGTGGTIFWLFPTITVISTPQTVTIDGRIESSFRFRAKGTFSLPGGTTPPTT
jgi:hypothetical protein